MTNHDKTPTMGGTRRAAPPRPLRSLSLALVLLASACAAGAASDRTAAAPATAASARAGSDASAAPDPSSASGASSASEAAVATPRAAATAISKEVVTDQRIAALVTARLQRTDGLEGVRAQVSAGVVRLDGVVVNSNERALAQKLAESVEGVVSVSNGLTLTTDVEDRLTDAWSLVKQRMARILSGLPVFVLAVAIILAANVAGRALARHARGMGWRSRNPYLQGLLERSAHLAVLLAGVLVALDLLGATALVGAVLGSVGVVGIVVGFAFRDVAENQLAGVLLALRRPFQPNDHIAVGSHEGRVIALTSRATVLMTLDGNHLQLPNAMVFKEVLLNYTRNPNRRFTFRLAVGINVDLREAQHIGVETIQAMNGILKDPPPSATIAQVGNNDVSIDYYAWIDQRESSFGALRSEAIRLVQAALTAAGMQRPEPAYRVQLLPPETQAPRAAAAQAEAPAPVAPQAPVKRDTELDKQVAEARGRHDPEDNLLTRPAPKAD